MVAHRRPAASVAWLHLIECYVVAASSIVSWTLVVRLFVGLYMATAYGGARPAANCVLLRTKPQELWDLAAPPFGTASVVAGYQQARLERLLHGKAESIPWQVAKTSSALPASPLGTASAPRPHAASASRFAHCRTSPSRHGPCPQG